MTRFAAFAAVLSLLLGGFIFGSGLHKSLLPGDPQGCDEGLKSTRHRSGGKPRTLSEGLQRRLCTFQARISGAARGRAMEHDFVLIGADRLQLPAIVDSNSPAFWDGDNLRVFNSAWYSTFQSRGGDVENLSEPVSVELPQLERPGAVWLESVWLDPATAVLFGWYHFEPEDLVCHTAPLIGAAVSYDFGVTWEDRGFVLDTIAGVDCEYANGYFFGGNGDFSVVVGPNRRYLYFLYTNYAGPKEQQGIGVARSLVDDKGQPGTLFKYYNNTWSEPGMGGRQTILFGTSTGWKGPYVESFWGPSVHWNTYINSFVVLLNHTAGEEWAQEGVYISFSQDMVRWTAPRKILEVNDWYPQVLGLGPGETDSLAGRDSRLFVGGISDFILQFSDRSGRRSGGRSASRRNQHEPLAD